MTDTDKTTPPRVEPVFAGMRDEIEKLMEEDGRTGTTHLVDELMSLAWPPSPAAAPPPASSGEVRETILKLRHGPFSFPADSDRTADLLARLAGERATEWSHGVYTGTEEDRQYYYGVDLYLALLRRAEAAEAALEKAREALTGLVALEDDWGGRTHPTKTLVETARDALAAMEARDEP